MTLKDVAEKAGVSYTTVSHVINGTRRVAAETSERVLRAVNELSYEPSAAARCLRKGVSGIIGVMSDHAVDPYFAEILRGIEEACRGTGQGILVCHSDGSAEMEEDNIRMLKSKGADGLIINSLIGPDHTIEKLKASRAPVLVLQSVFPEGGIDCLHTDDKGGARQAVQRLIELGHRLIACVAGTAMPHSSSRRRLEGYREALTGAGLYLSDDYLRLGDFSMHSGYANTIDLMRIDKPPTAIFLCSDSMALGALRALADLGISVPGQVSVAGFDDLPFCEFCSPRLSSVRHPGAELGRLAVERLRARAMDPSLKAECRALPSSFISRESIGPAPGV
jgi:LacI family transcriptional regulator